jgi:uncharacterized protein YndB with AHSA1/START domain
VSDDNVLRLERLIAAPPEKVFAFWTVPEDLVRWWGPDGYDVPVHDMDVRPGGQWHTTMRAPEGTLHTVSGIYRTVDAPRRLVFTWGWDDEDGMRGDDTEVTVTLEPAPGGTLLLLEQQPFESAESRDSHAKGWASSLQCLDRTLAQPVQPA